MSHPATIFFVFTLIIVFASWVGDIYGLNIRLPQGGGVIRVQSLLNQEGIRWMLQNAIPNFINFVPLGMVIIAFGGIGLAYHSGFLDACIPCNCNYRVIIVLVILLGILSNIVGDIGYIILLPIAAIMFRSVHLHPMAGIITAYVSVACGYGANIFLSVLDSLLAIDTNKAISLVNPNSMGVGPMCNYYFFFISTFIIGGVIYYVTCRYLLPAMNRYNLNVSDFISDRSLSRKERRALVYALIVALLYVIIIFVGTWLPAGILRGINGGIFYSPFMKNILFIISLGFGIVGIVYGFNSGRYHHDTDIVEGLISPMKILSVYFVIIFFASQLYACFDYSHLDKLLAASIAPLLINVSATPLITLLLFILITGIVNLVLTSSTVKWSFMSLIFVPFFMKIGISPDATQCAFRIGGSATNAVTPFLFYAPLMLTLINHYGQGTTYVTFLRYTWRYSLCVLFAWMLLFVVWYLCNIPFGC